MSLTEPMNYSWGIHTGLIYSLHSIKDTIELFDSMSYIFGHLSSVSMKYYTLAHSSIHRKKHALEKQKDLTITTITIIIIIIIIIIVITKSNLSQNIFCGMSDTWVAFPKENQRQQSHATRP